MNALPDKSNSEHAIEHQILLRISFGDESLEQAERKIPFSRAILPEEAIMEAAEVMRSGWLRQGRYAKLVEEELKKITGAKHAIATSSCTAALHTCLKLQGKKGQVAAPALTHPATQNAICCGGHAPRFVEVDENKYTLSPEGLKEIARKEKLLGVAPVHVLGIPCSMDDIMAVAQQEGLFVIEDCAQALGSAYNNRSVGRFGLAGCFSFDAIKPITAGEGGAIISDNDEFVQRARRFIDNGRDCARRHHDIGLNYKPTDFQMALLLPQLRNLDKIIAGRREIFGWYNELLDVDGIRTHPEFSDSTQNCIYYTVRLDKGALAVHEAMKERGIETKIHPPVNREPVYTFLRQRVPRTEQLCEHLLSLPVYPGLTQADAVYVTDSLKVAINELPCR